VYVSVDFPATFLNSLAAFELAGVTGGIDVAAAVFGSGSSANRAAVVDSGRKETLGAVLVTFSR
jgi:hypothetical protein